VSVCLKLVGLCCIIRSYRKRSHHVYGFITSLPLATYPYIFFSHIRSGIRAYVCQYAPTQKDPGSFTTPRRVAGHALQYADASLRADGDVVLEAVRQKVYSMEFAADELKAVKAFILKAMSINSAVLELSAEVIKADKDFMLEALKLSTEALGRADETIKSDKEVVLRAIEQNTLAAYDAAGLALDNDVMQEAAYRKGPLCGEIIAEIKEARKLPFRSREPEWFVGLYTSKFS